MICKIRLCSPDSYSSSAAELRCWQLHIFFTSRFFHQFCFLFCCLQLFLWPFVPMGNMKVPQVPSSKPKVNVTRQTAAIQAKAKIFITIVNATRAEGILRIIDSIGSSMGRWNGAKCQRVFGKKSGGLRRVLSTLKIAELSKKNL